MKVTESVKTRTVLVPFMCNLSIHPPKRYFIISCHSGWACPAGPRSIAGQCLRQAGLGSFTRNLSPLLLSHWPRQLTCHAQLQQGGRRDDTGEGWGMKETQSHRTEGMDGGTEDFWDIFPHPKNKDEDTVSTNPGFRVGVPRSWITYSPHEAVSECPRRTPAVGGGCRRAAQEGR